MNKNQIDIFSGVSARLQMTDAIELTKQSLQAHGAEHDHWGIAWSGGKDSSATLTLIVWMIESGMIQAPKKLSVFYADTRMELPPLSIAAYQIIDELKERDIDVQIVMAPMDKRFMVYMLGRGVPPPNNNTLRWCTRQIKIDPMQDSLAEAIADYDGSILMITGVRQGESAIRDQRITMSCGKDGAECGQGWYQEVLPHAKGIRGRVATLAPLLHWRVCHIWEWLKHWAPQADFGDWSTAAIADAYGGDEAEELSARTGCVGCPLAQEDKALDTVIAMKRWAYLAPLKRLRGIYRALREPHNRLRKPGTDRNKNGSLETNPQRMGPLTMEARQWALKEILSIQDEVNQEALFQNRPAISLINEREEVRIRDLIGSNTWPNKWRGDEPRADTAMDLIMAEGIVQPLLIA
ncbi:phosphoadenosine phosphosulfate reductase family protein [Salinisphaera sp. G21_0]|uniref:phosphoadenosine phosphosulfate reductase domain-containing protein n=1 Tax=Salinisphaera sp. G21_0 TaxID=2821094 RepID=UPI001ADA98CA|nr:phosphoadenosine phosphosulfate reductase family protein [Salinisphaera sp. G21_0]MBO9484343.1 phosphoadenosine phosphosulfate reductase family protein [Salinisphaera sp. G21_0]